MMRFLNLCTIIVLPYKSLPCFWFIYLQSKAKPALKNASKHTKASIATKNTAHVNSPGNVAMLLGCCEKT